MPSRNSRVVEVVAVDADRGGRLWQPVVGHEGRAVIVKVDEQEQQQLAAESVEVLGQCLPPNGPAEHRTGLIVGYVQSGKTLSFTTVSAIAHDNGYQLVIIIAGTSTNLLHQSTERLTDDLDAGGFWGRWQLYRSDDSDIIGGNADLLRAALSRWQDPEVDDDEKKTVLITVMKDRVHLDRLINILRQLDLTEVPTLVIDDEADQASLNIGVRKGDESSTYQRMLTIRQLLPLHTFLQYTATPQALLLINLIDQLSPDFGKVLTPGTSYTGGTIFFGEGRDLVRRIPQPDVPVRNVPPPEPPDSLIAALRLFFIGVAAGIISRYADARNRSMMIHPTHRVNPHATYAHWAITIKENWARILELEDGDRDKAQLLSEFAEAYDDLATTATLPEFSAISRKLPRSMRETRVETVNSAGGATQVIDWKRNYAWILVGGQALDRGFTVEGLTVTYMPRSLGVGNADTIQQRARWFGYKAKYLGFCRVFLPDDVITAYVDYVEHEEDVRERLRKHLEKGLPLKQWKRAFLLSGALTPTRKAVLGRDVTRGNYTDRWFNPRSPHASDNAISDNRRLINSFIASYKWQSWNEDPRLLNSHKHLVISVPLSEVYERLLLDCSYPAPDDSRDFTGVLLQIGEYLRENQDAKCSVYQMRPTETTTRGTDEDGAEISQLFQGAYPVVGDRIYPGDREIRRTEELTLQLHSVDIYKGPVSEGVMLAEAVPVLGVWVPADYSAPWVVQEQSVDD